MKRLTAILLMAAAAAIPVFTIVSCTNHEVLFKKTYNLRFSVKRAPGKYETDNNSFIYVHRGTLQWANKQMHARLVKSDEYDNPSAVLAGCNSTSPLSYQSPNDYCYKNSSPKLSRIDPMNPNTVVLTQSIFHLKPLYQAATLLGTGESSQTIGIIEFLGVEEGVYDLAAFVDTETRVEVNNNECTCTRSGGCSEADYETYTANKTAGNCATLRDISGQIMPSNGDVFYAVDNIVVGPDTESRLSQMSLLNDNDSSLYNTGSGFGDGDVWDEWRCIYHMGNYTGYSLHDYTFPKDNTKKLYCLPFTSNCPGGSTDGERRECGTLMDFNQDYNATR